MYILKKNTALFEEMLWGWVTVKVESFVVLFKILVATLKSN